MKCLVLSAWCLVLGVAPSVARADAENLPRNPFWPQNYEGMRYPIGLEPRFKPEPEIERQAPVVTTNAAILAKQAASAAQAEEAMKKRADPLEDPVWEKAVKTLEFGATMSFSSNGVSRAAVSINDRIYSVGDLISSNHEDHRFTWRVESLSSDGKIKLKRINYRKIGTNQ